MANKTATLKNQAGDNIYPNIVGDNRNSAIKDSTTIKHTLTENKISLDLDEAIKGKIDAALQKPTGLTKTKLVGVGTNGQENIEIGENLTLSNGKLSATGGGGSGGIPVVEGTFSETTEEGAQFTINIPQAQSGVFILSLPDITSYFIIGSFVGEYIGNFIAKNEDNPDELIINYFSGRDTTISLYGKSLLNGGGGNIVTIEVVSMPDTQTTIDVSAITNDTQFVNIKETSTNKNYLLYRVGSDFASCFSNEFAQGTIVGYYYIDTQQKQLYYFISSVGKMGKIFGNHDIQVPAVSSNNILPCTTADNGKVLSVVNGEAQWASVGGGVTVTFED